MKLCNLSFFAKLYHLFKYLNINKKDKIEKKNTRSLIITIVSIIKSSLYNYVTFFFTNTICKLLIHHYYSDSNDLNCQPQHLQCKQLKEPYLGP